MRNGNSKAKQTKSNFSNDSNVEDGLDFLLRVNEKNDRYVGKHVIVIGGGYTSMDCARTALRLGAKSVKTFIEENKVI